MPDTPQLLPADATWAGIVLLVTGALFVAALTIGLVARLVMPEKFVAGEEKGHLHDENAEPPPPKTPTPDAAAEAADPGDAESAAPAAASRD